MQSVSNVTVTLMGYPGNTKLPVKIFAYEIRCPHGFLSNGMLQVQGEPTKHEITTHALQQFGHFVFRQAVKPSCDCMDHASMRYGETVSFDAEHVTSCISRH